MNGLWAVLPVKTLDRAKSRLAPALSPDARHRVMARMVEQTFAAVAALALESVVVTSDPAVETRARGLGFAVLPDPGRDHSAAAGAGLRWARAQGASGVVTVASDLPLIAPIDLALLTERLARRTLVVAPDLSGTGTNALAMAPPVFRFAFGPGSLDRHVAGALALGLRVEIVYSRGLATDLDTPEDLARVGGVGRFARPVTTR